MPTWKLNPSEPALVAVLQEFIRRKHIDISTRRGQARVRAITAFIDFAATQDPNPVIKHYAALEDGDIPDLFALVEDWQNSLKRMQNERRPPHHERRGNRK